MGAFYLTMDRVERMDYSFFTWVDGFSLVVPNPGEESRLFAFVRPFQPWVNYPELPLNFTLPLFNYDFIISGLDINSP